MSPRAKAKPKEKPPAISDTEVMGTIAAAFDARQWQRIVDITDAWLEARGELPGNAAHFRAAALQGVKRYEEALPWAELSIRSIRPPVSAEDPQSVPYFASLIGYGQVLSILGHTAEAMRVYRAALKVPLTNPDSLASSAHLRLAIKPGQWRRGWRDHERRIGSEKVKPLPGPVVWDGGPTEAPVVVLHEQGIGDAVLFSRWLPMVAERSGHPVIWVGEKYFHRWVTSLPGVGQAVTAWDALAEDGPEAVKLLLGSCYVRAMSLPAIFDCTPETIPPALAPRCPPPPPLVGRPLRIGVSWQGSSGAHHDFERSLELPLVPILFDPPLPNTEYISLQHNTAIPDGWPLEPMGEGDILDSFERVASCDVVVTVDTAIAHMAGSLGIPTVVMPPMTVDWRYMGWPTGTGTPWYPSQLVVRKRSALPEDVKLQVEMARQVLDAVSGAVRQRHDPA